MKTELTREQTEKLVNLGLTPKIGLFFKFTDLLEILPDEINAVSRKKYTTQTDIVWCRLHIISKRIVSYRSMRLYTSAELYISAEFQEEELIDSMYKMVIWCVENGHINTKNEK